MPKGFLLFVAMTGTIALAACDARINPLTGVTPRPPVTVPTGGFDLREVDDEPLPHGTTSSGVTYALITGTFSMNADSTWLYSSTELLSNADNGSVIGSSPANYVGTWRVVGDTIKLSTPYGWMRLKGDTLFWRGGPRHTWEDTLTFTLVRK